MLLHQREKAQSPQTIAQFHSSPPSSPRAPCGIGHGSRWSGSRSTSRHNHPGSRPNGDRERPLFACPCRFAVRLSRGPPCPVSMGSPLLPGAALFCPLSKTACHASFWGSSSSYLVSASSWSKSFKGRSVGGSPGGRGMKSASFACHGTHVVGTQTRNCFLPHTCKHLVHLTDPALRPRPRARTTGCTLPGTVLARLLNTDYFLDGPFEVLGALRLPWPPFCGQETRSLQTSRMADALTTGTIR